MRVSDFIINYLRDYCGHIFLLPGGNSMHLVDSVGKSGIPYTVCLHEQACAFAAIGYAEYSGKLGVCITTSAPGALNALTGCAAAYTEGVPVLFISGQTSTNLSWGYHRLKGVQGINLAWVLGITKFFWSLFGSHEVDFILKLLVNTALKPHQGSTWLEVPLDIQGKEIDDNCEHKWRIYGWASGTPKNKYLVGYVCDICKKDISEEEYSKLYEGLK